MDNSDNKKKPVSFPRRNDMRPQPSFVSRTKLKRLQPVQIEKRELYRGGGVNMSLVILKDERELKLADGIVARVVTGESMTVAHVKLAKGAVLAEHKHVNEQIVNVMEGELELEVEGKKQRLVPGKVLILPPNIPHSGRAITDVYVVDAFHPVREDFRDPNFKGYGQGD
jgi:quercetin dioxygenase-like cupin family protein